MLGSVSLKLEPWLCRAFGESTDRALETRVICSLYDGFCDHIQTTSQRRYSQYIILTATRDVSSIDNEISLSS